MQNSSMSEIGHKFELSLGREGVCTIEFDREMNGWWMAEATSGPVRTFAYGSTRNEALDRVIGLIRKALRSQ